MQDTRCGRDQVQTARSLKPMGPNLQVVVSNAKDSVSEGSLPGGLLHTDGDQPSREGGGTRTQEIASLAYTRQLNCMPMTEEHEHIIIEHLPIVRYLARRIHERLPQQVDIEDLISSGVLGLIDALQKFDPEKKVQFRSYAQFRIRGAILDSLRTLDWSPRDLRRKGRAVEEAIRSLTARIGHAPSENEIAAELNMELSEYHVLLGELKGLEIGTLHAERSEDSGEEELAYIPTSPEEDPLFRCLKTEMQEKLATQLTSLLNGSGWL